MDSKTKTEIPNALIEEMVRAQFGSALKVSAIQPLTAGWFNASYALSFQGAHPDLVLRVAPAPALRLLSYEKESLGFFITGHPLARYESIVRKYANTDTSKVRELSDRSVVRIGGLIRDFKHYNDRKGDLMAFVTLEDLSGFVEVTLFSSLYSSVSDLIEKDAAVFIEGRVTRDEKSVKILGDGVIPIEKAEETWTTGVRLNLDMTDLDKQRLQELYNILRKHKGTCGAYLHLRMPHRTETIIALPDNIRLRPGKALTDEINNFLGYGAVETVCQKHVNGAS